MKKVLLLCFLLFISFVYADDFRFALMTDIHIGSSENALYDLKASVNQINNTPGIDFVIVAGDMAENGDNKSLDISKTELDKLNVKYYITSGNHDTKWSESGATHFSKIFGSDRFKFEFGGILFLGFNTGQLIRIADGHVLPEDINWLKSELQVAGKDKPVILVTHYPIREGDVDNWYEITDLTENYNVCAYLGGHYHRNILAHYDGVPGILCRTNLRGKDNVGGYTVFDIRNDSMFVYEQRINEEKTLWTEIYLKDNIRKVKEPRPDFSVNDTFPQVSEKWVVKTGSGIYSSPVVYKKKIFVADSKGDVTCYDMNGKKQWSFSSGNRIYGTPAVSDDVLVVGSTDKNIYGLDASTGKKLWSIAASEPVIGAVAIDKEIAYVGASDRCMRAIDIKTGKILWTYDGIKGFIETRPLITKNKVIFGAWDNTLYALSKKDGNCLWTWTGGLTRMHYSPAAVWPVCADGKIFIVDPQRAMTAIRESDGKEIWRTHESTVRESIGLSQDCQRVYAKTMNDSIVCFRTKGEKPVKIWACNAGYGYEFAPSMHKEKDGVVFSSTKNGLIFGIEGKTGKLLWKRKVSNSMVNTVIPISSKKILYTTANGEFGFLEVRNGK